MSYPRQHICEVYLGNIFSFFGSYSSLNPFKRYFADLSLHDMFAPVIWICRALENVFLTVHLPRLLSLDILFDI